MGRIVEVQAELDTDWKVIPVATAQFDLCTICNGSGDPDQLLIGGPASNGRYTIANGSIAANGPHNPFLLASGDSYTEGPLLAANSTPRWTVHMNGIQSMTTVNSVTFGFGTAYGALTVSGEPMTATPEPGTWILIGCGIVLIGIGRWRKRNGQTA